jgi:hypothetical protein
MVAFILQKENDTNHLRNEEKFRTTKPQESVELTVDKSNLAAVIETLEGMCHIQIMSYILGLFSKNLYNFS